MSSELPTDRRRHIGDRRSVTENDPIYEAIGLPELAKSIHGLHIICSQGFAKQDILSERLSQIDTNVTDHEARIRGLEQRADASSSITDHENRLREAEKILFTVSKSLETLTEIIKLWPAKMETLSTLKKIVYGLIALILVAVVSAIVTGHIH